MARAVSDAALAAHVVQLADAGYTIVEGRLDAAEVAAARVALVQLHGATAFGTNDFTGYRTKRVFNLLAKTRALDGLLTDPVALAVVRAALGFEAQLSIASTM